MSLSGLESAGIRLPLHHLLWALRFHFPLACSVANCLFAFYFPKLFHLPVFYSLWSWVYAVFFVWLAFVFGFFGFFVFWSWNLWGVSVDQLVDCFQLLATSSYASALEPSHALLTGAPSQWLSKVEINNPDHARLCWILGNDRAKPERKGLAVSTIKELFQWAVCAPELPIELAQAVSSASKSDGYPCPGLGLFSSQVLLINTPFVFNTCFLKNANWHASLCKKENLLEGYRVILENQMKNSLVKEEALQVPQQQDSARLSFKALHWCNLVPRTLNFTIISQGWASKYQEERIWLAQLESSSISSGQEDLVLIEGHFHRGRRCELIVIQKRCYC